MGGEAGGIACGKKIPSPKSSVRVALTAPSEGGETHTTCPSLSERGGCGVSGGRLVSVGTPRTVDSLAPSLSSSTVHEGRSVASTRGAEGGGGGANGGGGDGSGASGDTAAARVSASFNVAGSWEGTARTPLRCCVLR